jgi:WD40 repeat protein
MMDLKLHLSYSIAFTVCLLIGTRTICAAEKITYDDHVFPIFEQSCLNCHNPDKTKGGLDLSSYANTLKGGSGGKIVEPGDTASPLLKAVMGTGENKMPPEGDAISPAKIAALKAWIEGGLLENKNATARPPKKPSFNAAPSSSAGKKPEGPPPLPEHVLLDPSVTAPRGSSIRAIAASPWAPLIAVSSLRQVLLIHSESLELVGILPFPEGEPVSLAFTPDSRYLIVGGGIAGKSGTTITFDVTNGSRILTAAKEFDSILCCDIRPGFDIIATGSPSRLVKLWNAQENSLVKSIKKHTDWITSLDISSDGILLATGDRNGGVMVWEADSGGEFHTLRAHQAAITRAIFRHDSNLLGTSSEDGTIRMWEMNGGTEVKKIDAHPGGVTGFDWARDGTFASIGRDKKARLWKADFTPLRDLGKIPVLPTAIAMEAEGKRVFVGDADGHIHVINAIDGKIIKVLANNPPTLADRIQVINQQLTAFPELLEKVQQQINESQAKFDEQQKSITTGTTNLQQAKQAVAQAQQKLQALKGKIQAIGKNLSTKKTEAEALRAQFAAAKNALEQSRTALTNAQTAGEGPAIKQAQNATREAEAQLSKHSAALEKLDATIAALAKEEQTLQNELPHAEKELPAAQAKVPTAEAAIKPLREALPALEKSVAEAKKAQVDLAIVPQQLRQSRQRWITAQTNALALQAHKAAEAENAIYEEQIATFAEAAKQLETLAAAHVKEPTEASLKALQQAETQLITLRQQIEHQSPKRTETEQRSQSLKAEYHRQLAEKID